MIKCLKQFDVFISADVDFVVISGEINVRVYLYCVYMCYSVNDLDSVYLFCTCWILLS